jgi:hypothetical protein
VNVQAATKGVRQHQAMLTSHAVMSNSHSSLGHILLLYMIMHTLCVQSMSINYVLSRLRCRSMKSKQG